MTGGETGRELGAIHPGDVWGGGGLSRSLSRGVDFAPLLVVYAQLASFHISQTDCDEAKSSLFCAFSADVRRRTIGGRWKMPEPNETLSLPPHPPPLDRK